MINKSNITLPSIQTLFSSLNRSDLVDNSNQMYSNTGINNNNGLPVSPISSSSPSVPRYKYPIPKATISSSTFSSSPSLTALSSSSTNTNVVHNLQHIITPTSTPLQINNYKLDTKLTRPAAFDNLIVPTPPSSSVSTPNTSDDNCTCNNSSSTSIPKRRNSTPKHQHIPRPRNAFILYRQHLHHSLFKRDQNLLINQGSFKTNSQVSREIGQCWRKLSAEEKKYWQDLAQKEKELHKQKYPDYKYTPRKVLDNYNNSNVQQNKKLCNYCLSKK